MGILDHSRIFTSDRQARDYYKKLRWGRAGIRCELCSSRDFFKLSDGRYECRDCHNRFTDFTGTYLSGIKLDFRQVAVMVYLFCLEQSARRASRELGVNYKTAHRFFERIRRSIAQDACGVGLCGEIELDETYVGGRRKGKRGRGASGKVPVFGMLERAGKIVVEAVPDVREETLMTLVTENIEPGSLTYEVPPLGTVTVSEVTARY